MTTTRSILVPLTMDPETERALPHAVRLAELTGDPLVLFTWSFDSGEAALAQLHLRELARSLPVPASVVSRTTDEMSPALAIARAAATHEARIVMASHGRTGIGELVFGSIAEEVLREGHQPVVLVGPDATTPPVGPAGAIVACVDGSDLAESALPVATALAARIGAELRLVEVLDPALVSSVEAMHADVVESGYLARMITSLPEAFRPSFEVLHGEAAEAIVRHARTGTELLALATHGRSGVARTVLGSVAMGVVRHAACPVLVTPPAG